MVECYRDLVAGLDKAKPEQSLQARETIGALADRMVLTPSFQDPTVPIVDLEGALAGLLVLARAHDSLGANANKAAPLPVAALQSVLVAGAGYNEERAVGELRLPVWTSEYVSN